MIPINNNNKITMINNNQSQFDDLLIFEDENHIE
jgi:hypothetical protein